MVTIFLLKLGVEPWNSMNLTFSAIDMRSLSNAMLSRFILITTQRSVPAQMASLPLCR